MSSLLLLLPRPEVEQKITARIEAGKALLDEDIRRDEQFDHAVDLVERWHSYNIELLRGLFSGNGVVSEYGDSLPATGRGQTMVPLVLRIESFKLAVHSCLIRLCLATESDPPALRRTTLEYDASVPGPTGDDRLRALR